MSIPIPDPGGDPGGGDPGDPGYYPPPDGDAVLAAIVTATNVTFTADQIIAAGGPWPGYTVRVTAVNDAGSSTPVDFAMPV